MESMNIDSKNIDKELKKELLSAKKDEKFVKLMEKLKIDDKTASKYTSKLQETLCELENCRHCKGLYCCKNKLEGHVSYPKNENGRLIFSYVPCKYQEKLNDELSNKYSPAKNNIGLYLHGSFGSGKSFLVSALLNELHEKKKASVCMIYFPEALRTLKDDWDDFGSKIEYLKSVDILLIDDIGAEKVTEWGRDEVLGTILQARMDSKLATFFTSNLNIKELESHLALSNKSDDLVKARRIIERIKQLTNDLELISVNRREK